MTRLETLRAALLALTSGVYHFGAPPNKNLPYVVWGEDGGNDFSADGRHVERVHQGTIDLYTRDEYDPLSESIPAALDALPGCAWFLSSVQYEEDTGIIHWEWVWEL